MLKLFSLHLKFARPETSLTFEEMLTVVEVIIEKILRCQIVKLINFLAMSVLCLHVLICVYHWHS